MQKMGSNFATILAVALSFWNYRLICVEGLGDKIGSSLRFCL